MMIEIWRRATYEQKLQKVLTIGRSVNELVRAYLRTQYPDATPREIELRLAARNLDRETMIKAFGWDPDVRGR
jgi:HEPN domain-containing protein